MDQRYDVYGGDVEHCPSWDDWEAWCATQSPGMQSLMRAFPPGRYVLDGATYFLIGYGDTEDGAGAVLLTPQDPTTDHPRAWEARFGVAPGEMCLAQQVEVWT